MKKTIPIIITFLIFVTLCYAEIRICDSPIEPSQLPCMVVSTYDYGNCSQFNVMIFNSTPTLLDKIIYANYGVTDRCNVTFNYSERGSYTLNSSDGSSATIIVEGVKMEFLRLSIFGIFFVMGMIFILFMHKFKDDQVSIVYGFFASALFTLIGALGMFGFEFISVDEIALPFNINTTLGLIAIILAVYSAWISTNIVKEMRRPKLDNNGEILERE